jgi:phosphate transport system substrate-binding protein
MRTRRWFIRTAPWLLATGVGLGGASARAAAVSLRVGGADCAATLFELLGLAYAANQPDLSIEVLRGMGSAGALAAASEGVVDLAVTDRALKPEELARGLVEARFLETPLVFFSSHPSTQTLNRADVGSVFDGRMNAWPDGKPIKPILRPRQDAVTKWLNEKIPGAADGLEKLRSRPEVPVAATDDDNIALAERIPNSLAAGTLLQFLSEQPRLRLVKLGGVAPSLDALDQGEAMDMAGIWIAYQRGPAPALRGFLNWLGTPAAQAIMRARGGRPLSGS